MTGKVKWFDGAKGYGFIKSDEDSEEIFFHYSQIKMDGFKTLSEDDKVEFEITEENGKKSATSVVKIEE